jgi:NSS family neurotransmitter:Na+ symporter
VLAAAMHFAQGAIDPAHPETLQVLPASLVTNVAYLVVTVAMTCGVIALGVRRGIERLSVVALPVFFLLLVVLIARVLTLDGALAGLRVYLLPELENFTPQAGLAALGQAFFSLGLGGTMMITYGSYLRRESSIPATAIGTAAADVGAALLAGLIIVPAVIAFGLDLAGGPALMFDVMPEVLVRMPAPRLLGVVFFGAIFLVGLLSLVAAYEVIVAAASDAWGWSRRRAMQAVLGVQVVLGLPALLIGDYIAWSDLVWGTTMQPVGSALGVIAVGWCLGRARALEEMAGHSHLPVHSFLFYWIKYVLPAGIIVMLLYGWFG